MRFFFLISGFILFSIFALKSQEVISYHSDGLNPTFDSSVHVFLEIDLATCESQELLVMKIPLNERPLSLADIGYAPDGFLYGIDQFNGLYQFDLAEGEIVNSWPLPFGIQYGGMTINAEGLIILAGEDGRLASFDIYTEEFTDLGMLDDDFPFRLSLTGIAQYRGRLFGNLRRGHLVEIFLDEMRAEYIMESMEVEQSLFIFEEECDEPIFITGTNRGVLRLLDPDLDTFYNLCQFDELGSSIFTGLTSYTEYLDFPGCRDTIDLNGQMEGFDYYDEDPCGWGRVGIAGDSVEVYGEYPIDSIRLYLVEDPDMGAGIMEVEDIPGMTVVGSGTDELLASAVLDFEDWEAWLREVEYVSTADPPTSGLRRIAVVGYFNGGKTTDTAWAEIELLQPDFSAGEGAEVEECPTAEVVELFSYLSGADEGGRWEPEVLGDNLELLPGNSGTYLYIVEHPECGSDTARLDLLIWPGPDVGIDGGGILCAGSSTTLELQGDIEDAVSLLWSTGSTESEITVEEGGTYWVRMVYGEDCIWTDSVEVTLEESVVLEEEAALCAGQTLEWQSQIIDEPGEYESVLTGQEGECDTLLVLRVVESVLISKSTEISICPGSSYEIQGEELTEAGQYEFVLPSEEGCDTLLSLQLSWSENPEKLETVGLCPGSSYEIQGEELTEAGQYEFELPSEEGCDTLLSLQLSWLENPEKLETVGLCPGSSYEIQGEELTEAGQYEFVLPSEEGCDTLYLLNVEDSQLPEAGILGPDQLCEGESIELRVTPQERLDQIIWNTGQSGSSIEVFESGLYSFEATTDANCEVYAEKWIDVCPSRQIYIPNAFSPNGDGVNDEWRVYPASEVVRMELGIYDRWGARVYEQVSSDISWDGTFRGEKLPAGVYVYQLKVEFGSDQLGTFSGEIVLFR